MAMVLPPCPSRHPSIQALSHTVCFKVDAQYFLRNVEAIHVGEPFTQTLKPEGLLVMIDYMSSLFGNIRDSLSTDYNQERRCFHIRIIDLVSARGATSSRSAPQLRNRVLQDLVTGSPNIITLKQ